MLQILIDRVTYWDILCFTSILNRESPAVISKTMRLVSRSADGFLYPVLALLLFAGDTSCGIAFFAAASCAFALELPSYLVLKRAVKRDRPFRALGGIRNMVVPIDRFSFPSGHTAAAFVIASLLFHFFPAAGIAAAGWAMLVGFSRVYLGVHYPSDVGAGMVLGLVSAGCGLRIAAWIL